MVWFRFCKSFVILSEVIYKSKLVISSSANFVSEDDQINIDILSKRMPSGWIGLLEHITNLVLILLHPSL
uniref:Uncharacterized protein n=1 Tax=Kalanchoe fedtschenkoi TaxID=63787 RepID=A0A7N0RFT9_KALFE